MGACDFRVKAKGKTAKEAFKNAVDEARYNYGHGGYTGSIAEKNEFKMIHVPEGMDPYEYVGVLIENDDKRIADKWGPAGCIKIRDDEYLFFGYASS